MCYDMVIEYGYQHCKPERYTTLITSFGECTSHATFEITVVLFRCSHLLHICSYLIIVSWETKIVFQIKQETIF